MTASTFDTLAAADRLREAGFDDGQARAIVGIHQDAGADLVKIADLDTRITGLDAKLAELRADLYRALWIQGGAIVAILTALRFLPI